MRVLLSTYGSRGDVQPMAALAAQLKMLGAEVRVSAPPDEDFAELLARVGVPLVPAFSSVRHWITEMSKGKVVDIPRRGAEMMDMQFGALDAAAEGCDVILATGLFPSTAAAQSVAERRGIRYIYGGYCPIYLPSPHHRPLAFPGRAYPPEVTDNRELWKLNIATMNDLFAQSLNKHRASIGLPRLDNVRDHVFTDCPWLAADPVLAPWRQPADLDVVQTGAWILRDERPLPAELVTFLDAGSPPVYVGFGSMPMRQSNDVAHVAMKAIRAQGHRMLIGRGWAELAPVDDWDDCFAVGEVNQQTLFRRVAAVVHHGGAGTTTAAAQAGAPQVVVPQIADQPYWASRVADLGIGVAHAGPTPTAESLSAALERVLTSEVKARASDIASTMRSDGAAVAAKRLLAS